MILKFGKFKGEKFENTPKWYQDWLLKQDWFSLEDKTKTTSVTKTIPSYQRLGGWDGYSRSGQAAYDAVFEQEKAESESMYYGCGSMKDPKEKYCGFFCIAEVGMI